MSCHATMITVVVVLVLVVGVVVVVVVVVYSLNLCSLAACLLNILGYLYIK